MPRLANRIIIRKCTCGDERCETCRGGSRRNRVLQMNNGSVDGAIESDGANTVKKISSELIRRR